MDQVAQLSTSERLELFEQVSAHRNLALEIVEKDFWVCWTLKILFSLPNYEDAFIFNGDTSLSKGFGLIERFSEDIDISIRRETLGFVGAMGPEEQPSLNKQKNSVDALRIAYRNLVKTKIFQAFDKSISDRYSKNWEPIWGYHSISNRENENQEEGIITFRYPAVRQSESKYIPQQVRIEFGASSDSFPIDKYPVRSYAQDLFPHLFPEKNELITILLPERTFWEKITLVHVEYHRPDSDKTPVRISRHYYDIYCLSQSEAGKRSLKNLELLERVAKHKTIYYRSAWARYDLARPGFLRIVPQKSRQTDLENDYRNMQGMFYGKAPTWQEIMLRLAELETEINSNS